MRLNNFLLHLLSLSLPLNTFLCISLLICTYKIGKFVAKKYYIICLHILYSTAIDLYLPLARALQTTIMSFLYVSFFLLSLHDHHFSTCSFFLRSCRGRSLILRASSSRYRYLLAALLLYVRWKHYFTHLLASASAFIFHPFATEFVRVSKIHLDMKNANAFVVDDQKTIIELKRSPIAATFVVHGV